MRNELIYSAALVLAVSSPRAGAQVQAQATQTGPAAAASVPAPITPPKPTVPEGFTALFNGQDLSGWHVSRTNHHGTTPDYRVVHGMIVATQSPFGQGGILLTDKKYKNVELYMEVKPDYGCDSGLFFRSSEAGHAYQVTMDYLPGGSIGGIYGEGLEGVDGRRAAPAGGESPWLKVWKREDWNKVRVRIAGDAPHITVWINDQQVTDFTDTANHAKDGITEGAIAIQVHGGNRWVPGGFWRWRTIAVKELPADAK